MEGPLIKIADASYQVLIHLARQFQRRRFFRNQPIRNKNDLWRPCLLTERDEMTNLNRGPSIDAFYQVSECELLPSLGVRRPLTFHILIFSSDTPQPNELTLGRKHLWKVLLTNSTIASLFTLSCISLLSCWSMYFFSVISLLVNILSSDVIFSPFYTVKYKTFSAFTY
jgi:hypothetical protein